MNCFQRGAILWYTYFIIEKSSSFGEITKENDNANSSIFFFTNSFNPVSISNSINYHCDASLCEGCIE